MYVRIEVYGVFHYLAKMRDLKRTRTPTCGGAPYLPVGSNDAPRKPPIDGKDQNTRAEQHERHRHEPQKASFAERNDERTRGNTAEGTAGNG